MITAADKSSIKASTLFHGLSDDIVTKIVSIGTTRHLRPGERIFNQDDPATDVFVVLNGLVKLSRTSQAGEEIVVEVFSTGQSFAEALAFASKPYPVTATVVLGARLLVIPSAAIRAELHASPEITDAILASAYLHLHRLVEHIERLKGDSSLKRTARFILALTENGEGPAQLPYSKTTIASVIGIKPETLSRNFRKLEEMGVHVDGDTVRVAKPRVLVDLVYNA